MESRFFNVYVCIYYIILYTHTQYVSQDNKLVITEQVQVGFAYKCYEEQE